MRANVRTFCMLLLIVMSCTVAGACAPRPSAQSTAPTAMQFEAGRNDFQVDVEGTRRNYLVYVPRSYDANRPTPVVFMYHGTNERGRDMYESTGWAAKADSENFIVVYPSSGSYALKEGGEWQKWNTTDLAKQLAEGQMTLDDVKFTRTVLDSLKTTFNVDGKRLYATGFSNGGRFVLTRLIPAMHDVFSAYATAGAGFVEESLDSTIQAGIDAPLYSVLGTEDEILAQVNGIKLPMPMDAEEMVRYPVLGNIFTNTPNVLALSPAYTVQYDQPNFTTLTYDQSLGGTPHQFVFRMVQGMKHVYPGGSDNPAGPNAADLFWDFFKQYSKP